MKANLLLIVPSLVVLGPVFGASPSTKGPHGTRMCMKGLDYSEADKQGTKFERESVKKANTSIPTLGKDLASPFTNPILKARAIFTWLHHNVVFDAVPNSTRKSSELVIIKGIAVGQDYARLFEELGRGAGLDVITILGHGKGHGGYKPPPPGVLPPFESNHAWNALTVDGKWQLIDPSYGARVRKIPDKKYAKKFDSKPFESSPEVFRLTHYPEKPEYQFCSEEQSWKDYIFVPKVATKCNPGMRKMGLDTSDVTPRLEILPAGVPMRFVVKSMCENPPHQTG